MLDTVRQDARQAVRMMRKNPAFAATAILTLALGIGANTAVFTVIRTVLLKPLPYRDPDRVVRISSGVTTVRYREMQAAEQSFGELGCFRNFVETVALSGAAEPESLQQSRVSYNFLRILGVEPELGRGFRPEEDSPDSSVVMISDGLWRRRFHADPSIAGRPVTLGTRTYTIVGVLPEGFSFPFPAIDVWFTNPPAGDRPVSPVLGAFGRLRAGVTVAQATAEAEVLHRQYSTAHPGMLDGRLSIPARAVPLKEDLVAKIRSLLWMLFGAVSLVLLIACANVAGILLARASSRTREFALRAALGAARGRLISQLLTESTILALAGGALGLLLARWSIAGIGRLRALGLPRTGEIKLDTLVLAVAVALSIGAGLLFGLAPSLSGSRPDLAGMLRASGEGSHAAGSRRRFGFSPRSVLVAAQVALSTVLLIGAALLLESMANLSSVDPGFRTDHLLTMQISLAPSRYDKVPKMVHFFDELMDRLQRIPGVAGAAACRALPFSPFPMTPTQPTDRPTVLLAERPLSQLQEITPGYFRAMKIPLLAGREFTARDGYSDEPVVIINEKQARIFWPDHPDTGDPVGRQILIGANHQPVRIVGVAADAHQGLETAAYPVLYRPFSQTPLWTAALVIHTQADPLRYANAVRAGILAVDRDQPVYAVKTMEEVEAADFGQRRFILQLLGIFAALALTLTIVGIYGVIAYSVAQRTREVGIRRALGAQQGSILWLVVGEGLGVTLAGVVLGGTGAFALTRWLSSMLFHVSATDPATFAAVAVLLSLLAMIACYIPARRAARIDPMAALRES